MGLVTNEHRVDVSEAQQTFEDVQPAVTVKDDEPLTTLLEVAVNQFQRLDLEIDELYDQRFVDTATSEELERLGANVGIDRKTGEGDDKYRKRVRAGYAAATSRGTYEDIARVALLVLDAAPTEVTIDRARDTADPGTALVLADSSVVDSSPFTISEMEEILGDAAVGGHRVILQRSDVFTWDDSSLGWGTDWAAHVE